MEKTGDDVPPKTDQHDTDKPKAPPRGAPKPQLTRVVNFLEDATRIGTFYINHPKYRRYVDLNRNDLFNALVDLYTIVFKTFWQQFRRFIETCAIPPAYENQPQRFAAAIYISAWFYDLYVSNRQACRKLSDSAYIEHYYMDLVHKSTEYDVFLVALNAQIRPTNVKLTHEDTLFIPRIRSTINANANDENYFNITGWVLEESILQGIIYVLKERKLLHMEALAETSLGRPSWLFDWHVDNLCYAWFPAEGNYTFEDVTIAYIIGVACTPKLGPRDYDEWQPLPGNVIPANTNHLPARRIRQLTYHAAVELDRIETRSWQIPPAQRELFELTAAAQPQPQPQQPQGGEKPAEQPPPAKKHQPKAPKARAVTYGLRHRPSTSGTAKQAQTQTTQTGEDDNEEEVIAEEEEEGEVNSTTNEPQPDTLVGEINNVQYTVVIPPLRQFRVTTYLCHARVVNYIDMNTRVAALRQFIYQSK